MFAFSKLERSLILMTQKWPSVGLQGRKVQQRCLSNVAMVTLALIIESASLQQVLILGGRRKKYFPCSKTDPGSPHVVIIIFST